MEVYGDVPMRRDCSEPGRLSVQAISSMKTETKGKETGKVCLDTTSAEIGLV